CEVEISTIGFPFAVAGTGATVASTPAVSAARTVRRSIRYLLVSFGPDLIPHRAPQPAPGVASVMTLVPRRSRQSHQRRLAHDVGLHRHARAIEHAPREPPHTSED